MLFASHDAPRRPGYIYQEAPGGSLIGYPASARPSINRKHIDGPLLYMRNGEMHWLTWRERFQLWLGRTDALTLERKHRPDLQAAIPRLAPLSVRLRDIASRHAAKDWPELQKILIEAADRLDGDVNERS
jgi:hypothetical protein